MVFTLKRSNDAVEERRNDGNHENKTVRVDIRSVIAIALQIAIAIDKREIASATEK